MQLLYVADEAIFEEQSVCRKKLQKLNFMDRSDFDGVAETVKDLFGKTGKDCTVNPPFYCDYGSHIEVGSFSQVIYSFCVDLFANTHVFSIHV